VRAGAMTVVRAWAAAGRDGEPATPAIAWAAAVIPASVAAWLDGDAVGSGELGGADGDPAPVWLVVVDGSVAV
jgi:hypothetical protein